METAREEAGVGREAVVLPARRVGAGGEVGGEGPVVPVDLVAVHPAAAEEVRLGERLGGVGGDGEFAVA